MRKTRRLNKESFYGFTEDGRVKVPLTQGRFAIIDVCDFRRVVKHSWCVRQGGAKKKIEYAQSNIKINGEWRRIDLHRFILQPLPGERVDHEDGNGLNCTRTNMRLAGRCGNQRNTRSHTDSISSFKGVTWHRKAGKWVAQIMAGDGRQRYLGLFVSEEDAARAYDTASRELHGEFARPNFSEVVA